MTTHEIIHANSLEILEDRKLDFDHLIADPPYVMPSNSTVQGAISYADLENYGTFYQHFLELIKEQVGARQASAWIFTNWKTLGLITRAAMRQQPPVCSTLVWHKTNTMGLGSHLRPVYELCAYVPYNGHRIKNRSMTDFVSIAGCRSHYRAHKAQKPVDLMRYIVRELEGETILDPFAGSGSTAVAAVLEGRSSISIEASDHLIPIIEARVAYAQKHGEDMPAKELHALATQKKEKLNGFG